MHHLSIDRVVISLWLLGLQNLQIADVLSGKLSLYDYEKIAEQVFDQNN